MKNKDLYIFADFDGTITTKDVGVSVLDKFAIDDWRKYEDMVGKLSVREMLTKEWDLFRGKISDIKEKILPIIPIDPGFEEFYNYIISKSHFSIVSDGFYFYITELLLKKAKSIDLGKIKIIANEITENKDNTVTLSFANEPCEHGCANCKANHVINAKNNEKSYVIYIGDGISDYAAAPYADKIFAKKGKDLEKNCLKNNVDYVPFSNFNEILEWFKENEL